MSEMTNRGWIERQTASPESRRLYEEERLILWATEAVAKAMANQGLTRAQLAGALGTSRPNVTQLLSGSRNMTLRTLAALAHACGARAAVQLEPLSDWRFEQLGERAVQRLRYAKVQPVVPITLTQLELDQSLCKSEERTVPGTTNSVEPAPLALVA